MSSSVDLSSFNFASDVIDRHESTAKALWHVDQNGYVINLTHLT